MMKFGFFISAVVLLASLNSYATVKVSQNLTTTNSPVELPVLPDGSNVNDEFIDITATGIGTDRTSGTMTVEAYVEVSAIRAVSAVCRLKPTPFLNRPIDPSQTTIQFVVETPTNQGINPQVIAAKASVSRSIFAKIPPGIGGALYRLQCRRQIDNSPVTIQYASLKINYVSSE